MKNTLLFFLISFSGLVYGQKFHDDAKIIKLYADSLDTVITDSDGIPGSLMNNSVSIMRNERAIGMQYTKIIFWFEQREDSVIDNGNEVLFYPVYNPPVKITVEYNIAASQNVSISYYFYNKYIYYTYKSTGAYGYDEAKYILTKSDLKYLARYDKEGKNPSAEKYKEFTKEEIIQSGKVYSNWLDYEKLYFQTFNAGQLDK